MFRKLSLAIIAFCFIALYSSTPTCQGQSNLSREAKAQKFKHAIVRSQDAAKIVDLLHEMRDSGFPKELMDKAQGIAVFPLVEKEAVLFAVSLKGYGVVSTRIADGWSPPAFYGFGGGGYTGKLLDLDSMAVIILFMDKASVARFEKGGVQLKKTGGAAAGPVGSISDEQKKQLESAHILSYVFWESKLKGQDFGTNFKSFIVNPDNNINKPMYGMKGREVLAGKLVDTSTVPEGITAYQEALNRLYAKR